jgi:hypothetical protein
MYLLKVRSLGKYTLAMDTAPTISIGKSIEGKWLSTQKQFNFQLMIVVQE